MTGFPSGTVTFLYTDIEGSTRLWEEAPEAMRQALRRHDEILRQAIHAHSGQVFRTAGDALCAVFTTAPQAVAAAGEAQRQLNSQAWSLPTPLRVRMVLHTGQAEVDHGDYVGASLNLLGRLLAVCSGGQTLLSQASQALVLDSLPPGTSLLDLGEHRFRDMARAERIFQLRMDGLDNSFPPLSSLASIPNNLPAELTSFIGRAQDLAEVERLLASARLVTLTGPGGTGKTRLALQSAARLLENFPDGAWLVELAPLADPGLVLQSLAAVFNLRPQPQQSLSVVLLDYLRRKNLLIVLDNCEHLIEACAELAQLLLQSCPEIRILASSREALGIAGEFTYRVPSLSLPATSQALPPAVAQQYEAVRLFVERAAAALPHFLLTERNAAIIAQICRRLDGIPLAIELAAARVRLFSLEQIAARLDDRFRLLTGGSRTALPRQQTLRALIDWSYDLLSEPERALFCRLSVFAGGWTFDAAEAVCAGEAEQRLDLLELLAQLVNKSLVIAEEQAGETRYRLLETIRQYARDKLLEAGEAEHIRDLHLDYFYQFSRQARQNLYRAQQFLWLKKLEIEHDNLRAALEWALSKEPFANDLNKGLSIAGDLSLYWGRYGFGLEGQRWLEAGIARAGPEGMAGKSELAARQAALAKAYNGLGMVCVTLGQNPKACLALEKSTALYRQVGDLSGLAGSLCLFSLPAILIGNIAAAQAALEESIALARTIQDKDTLALSLGQMAHLIVRSGGSYEAAQKYIEESRDLLRELGDAWSYSVFMFGMIQLAMHKGDFEASRRLLQESRAIFQQAGDIYFINGTRSMLAEVARLQGDFQQAIPIYQKTIEVWQTLGNRGAIARCLECLAFIAGSHAATGSLEPSQRLADIQRAATLLGAAEAIRQASQSPMTYNEQQEFDVEVEQLRRLAGSELEREIETAWNNGRGMDIEQAVGYALEMQGGERINLISRTKQ